ncbi:MAG: peptide chain release factor 3 [Pseudomonadota bacterium]|nr:peptide chain release factor 3 [Pseudomonadota bacterium]
MTKFETEISKRRTFAIISHPDAGKTTITEKILYNCGAINVVGEVRGKAGTKAATSDWMKMEQERGVSITSSVMQFDYEGLRFNLLDTPGHKDFGEDTYRTLIAADCATMLIDAAKGVEAQTRKLYEVCRMRKMPIFTFANKMDREGKNPLELIDDVENTLQMACYPIMWPIGMGGLFRGLYHRLSKKIYLYEKGKVEPKIVSVTDYDDKKIEKLVGTELFETFVEELTLLQGITGEFDQNLFLSGKLSPMTFGSAKNNWGVDLFLSLFTKYSPPPQPRETLTHIVLPADEHFSGFVFKIQANMDRRHRDRVSFIRVCSGQFERGMKVTNLRSQKELRLSYANQFLAQERETVDLAYAGDIIGINDSGNLQIGDTLSTGKISPFQDIPRFSPEHFGRVLVKDALKRKQLEKGLQQLVDEGAIQFFYDPLVGKQDPVLGVVGLLQFDVLLYRLKDEYGLAVQFERLPYQLARWPKDTLGKAVTGSINGNVKIYHDVQENPVLLFNEEWDLRWLQKQNPDIEFRITS